MQSSWTLRHAVLRTDVSEERIASIIRVTRMGEIGTALAVTSNRSTLRSNIRSSENVGSYKNQTALHTRRQHSS
jgi:hypothetical protein